MEFIELLEEVLKQVPAKYSSWVQGIEIILPILILVISLVTCFFGHKVHKLWNIFLFFWLGFWIVALSGIFFPATWDIRIFIGLGLIVGILAAIKSNQLHHLQLFIINSFMAFSILPSLLENMLNPIFALLLGLLLSIGIGLLAAKLKYLVTIVSTSIHGAMMAAPLLWNQFNLDNEPLIVTTALILMILGIIAQFYQEHVKKSKEKHQSLQETSEQKQVNEEKESTSL